MINSNNELDTNTKWINEKTNRSTENEKTSFDEKSKNLLNYCQGLIWRWPSKAIVFITDIHADQNAYINSLKLSGMLSSYDGKELIFSPSAKQTTLIIGGDLFDKGPENLPLLNLIHQTKRKGINIVMLAGNHDVRTYTGLYYFNTKDLLKSHLFARMGKKAIPLFKEIFDTYLCNTQLEEKSELDIKKMLFPHKRWYKEFPRHSSSIMDKENIKKELTRIREKVLEIDQTLKKCNLTYNQLYHSIIKARELFIWPNGRYYWIFNEMKLLQREGPLVFVHGGFDDKSALMFYAGGEQRVNLEFTKLLKLDPFLLYYGPLGNMFRTKYRSQDFEFTQKGVSFLQQSGIHAILHGHKNIINGHKVHIKKGILNFECDISMDSNTRKLEGLPGVGGGAIMISPNGYIQAISTDNPNYKTFKPDEYGSLVILPKKKCQKTTLSIT